MDASATPFSRRSSRRLHGVPALSQALPTAVPGGSVQAGAVAAAAGAAAAALGAGVPPPADGRGTTLDTLPAWALTAILWRLPLRARAAVGATCRSLHAAVGDAVPQAVAVGVFKAVPLAVAPAVDAAGGSARSGWGDPPSKRQRLADGGAAAPRWKLMNHVVTRAAVVVQGTATLAVLAAAMRRIPDLAIREEMRRQLDGIVAWMEEKGGRIANSGGGRSWAFAGDTFSSDEGSDEDGFLSSSDDRRRLHDIIRPCIPIFDAFTLFAYPRAGGAADSCEASLSCMTDDGGGGGWRIDLVSALRASFSEHVWDCSSDWSGYSSVAIVGPAQLVVAGMVLVLAELADEASGHKTLRAGPAGCPLGFLPKPGPHRLSVLAPATAASGPVLPLPRALRGLVQSLPPLSRLPSPLPSTSQQTASAAGGAGAAAGAAGGAGPAAARSLMSTRQSSPSTLLSLGLLDLPTDVLMLVLLELPLNDRASMAATCTAARAAVGDWVPLAAARGVLGASRVGEPPGPAVTDASVAAMEERRRRALTAVPADAEYEVLGHRMWRSGVVAQGRALLDAVCIAARSLRPAAGRRLIEQLLTAVQLTEGVVPWDPSWTDGGRLGGETSPWWRLRSQMSLNEEARVLGQSYNRSYSWRTRPSWAGETGRWTPETLMDVLRCAFDRAMRDTWANGSTCYKWGPARNGQLGMVLVAAMAADRLGDLRGGDRADSCHAG